MHTATDDRKAADGTNRLADLAEGAAVLFTFFCGLVMVAALVAALIV